MPSYLVSCQCGRQVAVSTSMAGESVRCACGTELAVPTLRELRQLPLADEPAAGRRWNWTNRNRLTFVLAVAALLAAGVAGFLALSMPPAPQATIMQSGPPLSQSSSADQVLGSFAELERGIRPQTNVITHEVQQIMEQRIMMTWGIRLTLALAAVLLAAAAMSAVLPARAGR